MTTKQGVRMHTGMLWFDNDANTILSVKIQKAIDYYIKKFKKVPNICLVHPSMIEPNQKSTALEHIAIRANRNIVPGHFWVGIEEVDAPVAKSLAAVKSI